MRNSIIIERPDLAIDMVLPVKANTIIHAGEVVGIQTSIADTGKGFAIPFVGEFYDSIFMGIAQEDADSRGKENGEVTVKAKLPKILKCSYNSTPITESVLGYFAFAESNGVVRVEEDYAYDAARDPYLVGKVIGIDKENNSVVIRTGV